MRDLRFVIAQIETHDTNYLLRYGLILQAVELAHRENYAAGFRIDPSAPDWPVAYIELPTGQVSWHMPQHPHAWDGHTTDEKYARIRTFCQGN